MRILNRYIRTQVIWSTAVVVCVLVGIQSFMEFVGQLSAIGVGHYTVLKAFLFVPLQIPTDLYQLFPMAGFLGSLIGLGRLASSSELIVMRAAGISVRQIAWSVIKAALIMIVFVTIIGEWLAPQWQNKAGQMKAVAMGKSLNASQSGGIWLRKGNDFTYVAKLSSPTTIEQVSQFQFDNQHHLIRILRAEKGTKHDSAWTLYNVHQTSFDHNKINASHLASAPMGVLFEPSLLKHVKQDVDLQSIASLFHNILYRKQSGLVTSQYQYAFWKRIMQPITTVVMIILGIPFIFGSLRSSSMGLRIMTGVIIGFGFYMLNQFFGPITLVYQFPPWLAAAMPTVLFIGAYAILVRRVT